MKNFPGWLALAVGLVALAPLALAQTEAQLEAARRYAGTRSGILNYAKSSRPAQFDLQDRRILSSASAGVLRQYRSGPDWNPQNPEWQRLAAIVERDIEEMIRELAKDDWVKDAGKRIEEVMVRGLATRLTVAELEELHRYYSDPPAAQFAQVQEKLINVFASGMQSLQAQMLAGQKPQKPAAAPPPEELKEILSLFDETVRMQWAIADPGPGRDRSGLQAIPFIAMAIVQANYEAMAAIWKEMPEEDRKAVLAWRNSPLARKEREAIFESAKGIGKALDAEGQMRRLAESFARYEAKWRALIQGKRE